MAGENLANTINDKTVASGDGVPPDNGLTVESTVLLITTGKVRGLEDETRKELNALRERQKEATFLHRLIKALNTLTSAKGELNLTNEADIKEILAQAKEINVELDPAKNTYKREERDRLIENIRLTTDDINMQNDMQIQTISRLTNERYEMFQMARTILKPLHEMKVAMARNIALK